MQERLLEAESKADGNGLRNSRVKNGPVGRSNLGHLATNARMIMSLDQQASNNITVLPNGGERLLTMSLTTACFSRYFRFTTFHQFASYAITFCPVFHLQNYFICSWNCNSLKVRYQKLSYSLSIRHEGSDRLSWLSKIIHYTPYGDKIV